MPPSPPVDLVGVGLNDTNTLISLSRYPAPGSKVEYDSQAVLPGGQVASAVVACRKWGMSARYVGVLGDDEAGRIHRAAFAEAGVEAQVVSVPDAPSAHSVILVDGGGERTVLSRRVEKMRLEARHLDRLWIVNAKALLVDGFDTAAAAQAAAWAREAGIPVVADLDETYPGVEELVVNTDYLIVSRDFPGRLVDESNLETALRKMMNRFGCRLTAATLGQDGVLAWDGRQLIHRPAYRVPVVDTTGAGDIFHAGFLYGLHRDWPLARQLDFACAAAALNCSGLGARGNIQSLDAIEELMAAGSRYDVPDGLPGLVHELDSLPAPAARYSQPL
jgi:sulfofructose kinase